MLAYLLAFLLMSPVVIHYSQLDSDHSITFVCVRLLFSVILARVPPSLSSNFAPTTKLRQWDFSGRVA